MMKQKGFTSVEILMAIVIFSAILGLFYSGYQSLIPARVLAAGEQARQWAFMAEVLRSGHGQTGSGAARNFLHAFGTAPGPVRSPFSTEYTLQLFRNGAAEASVLVPAPGGGLRRRTYYAEPAPHSRATLDKVLLYRQRVR